jgi:urea transporter
LFRGVGEVFLQDNLWTGVVLPIAILLNSRICFGLGLLGSALGGLTALMLGDGVAIYHGLYGFNAVLTGIALGGRPDGLACPRRSCCSTGGRRSTR